MILQLIYLIKVALMITTCKSFHNASTLSFVACLSIHILLMIFIIFEKNKLFTKYFAKYKKFV